MNSLYALVNKFMGYGVAGIVSVVLLVVAFFATKYALRFSLSGSFSFGFWPSVLIGCFVLMLMYSFFFLVMRHLWRAASF